MLLPTIFIVQFRSIVTSAMTLPCWLYRSKGGAKEVPRKPEITHTGPAILANTQLQVHSYHIRELTLHPY